MKQLFREVDRLLRGGYTGREALRRGEIGLAARRLLGAVFVLGWCYGLFMGLYAVMRPAPSVPQMVATVVKVPLLFLFTLAVTLPSLYVFSALADSKLTLVAMLRLFLAAIAVSLAVLASFGPVVGFFTLSTDSYPFMVLLNVLLFAIAGVVGLVFPRRALAALFEPEPRLRPEAPPPAAPAPAAPAPDPREELAEWASRLAAREKARAPDRSWYLFRAWVVIFAVVGAQMGWILRPFIGAPDRPFTILRERQSNFFEAVLDALRLLFS